MVLGEETKDILVRDSCSNGVPDFFQLFSRVADIVEHGKELNIAVGELNGLSHGGISFLVENKNQFVTI